MQNLSLLFWPAFAFFCGAIPFSLIVGRLWLGVDIRQVGDGNPGATNVMRAARAQGKGRTATLLPTAVALLLDIAKGIVPVSLAFSGLGMEGVPLALIAVLPIAGHAFSPFLGFSGGKAVATTGGVWIALTAWEGPLVGGLLLGLASRVVKPDGWIVLVTLLGLLGYFVIVPPLGGGWTIRPPLWPTILLTWLGNFAIVIWKQRSELTMWPRLQLGK